MMYSLLFVLIKKFVRICYMRVHISIPLIPQFRLSVQLSYVKYGRYGRNKIFPSTFLLIASDGRISSGKD